MSDIPAPPAPEIELSSVATALTGVPSPASAVRAPFGAGGRGLTARCLAIDLEVGIKDDLIHAFAAVRGDNGRALTYQRGGGRSLQDALMALDVFGDGLDTVVGHNLIAHDLPHLAAAHPESKVLRMAPLDTLWINPIAFPRNPYHRLVKVYQDGPLHRGSDGLLNDPELDARLTLKLLEDQFTALGALKDSRDGALRLQVWHGLTSSESPAFANLFAVVRGDVFPPVDQIRRGVADLLQTEVCQSGLTELLAQPAGQGWPLAYAIAWLSVAGGNSVLPPWVRHQFPETARLLRRLRDMPCGDSACAWCREKHDPARALQRWFGFAAFRPEPRDPQDGRPLQHVIVEAAMRGQHLLAILPTGTGKSICYQIPALSRFEKTGALTVVISPLVALMADQVRGLREGRGIECCAAVNGLLSLPERADVLDKVRMGDIGILIISPEQLRNRSVRRALAQREIGAWVLDEAHCLSKWGHAFRPDYRYVGRFIRETAKEEVPPILCLTATAKPDVVEDISDYFRDKVGIELRVINGGSERRNLDFYVIPSSRAEKLAHVVQVLQSDLPAEVLGGAIVYCATRGGTEELSQYLVARGWQAAHFHAGLASQQKQSVQKRFIDGELRVIVATNAFGMGIDKPDVRLVVHADVPGSLENYLQEAGRAGRDTRAARCVLLHCTEDVERQFGMSARSRLKHREIQAVLRAIGRINGKKRMDGEVVATAGEILGEEESGAFERDSATDDTRVRTAISWLEEATLVRREENRVQVFPSSLRVRSLDEARAKLVKAKLHAGRQSELLALVEALMAADSDEGISTDELMGVSGLGAEPLRAALAQLQELSIASNDTAITAFVHVGVEHASMRRLESSVALEAALIDALRSAAPDLEIGEETTLNLRKAAQALRDAGQVDMPYGTLVERVNRQMRGLANDGKEDGGTGHLRVRRIDGESRSVRLQSAWSVIAASALRRHMAARLLLEHLLATLPEGARGNDQLASTTMGKLLGVLEADIVLRAEGRGLGGLLERGLLWLHDQEVLRLNKGLAVFRPAMTIVLAQDASRRKFLKPDYEPLKLHYDEQVVQIHVMAEYVKRGVAVIADAVNLASDYFKLPRAEFLKLWMPGREKELAQQTTPESWRRIVENLNNSLQQSIVTDDRERPNALVLAGPGSGKTRVLVHRIAYLVRVLRENPAGIIALAYNRHAAVEIRRRLDELLADDARGISVMTCHGLAMRLSGVTWEGLMDSGRSQDEAFAQMLRQAVALLKGDELAPDEADERRDQLLAGFNWILVDEYQDINADQYELISALAGRSQQDPDRKLSLFAVGDDDQNIYSFQGASVEFIRRFEKDYQSKPFYLVENYRSTAHIIAAANAVIGRAADRMKVEHAIRIDRRRIKLSAGGTWEKRDPVARGRVQILPVAGGQWELQAVAVVKELQRLASLAGEAWDWSRVAVISPTWRLLDPVRSYCEWSEIPVQMGAEHWPSLWQLRETVALLAWARALPEKLVEPGALVQWVRQQPETPWWQLLREAVDAYAIESPAVRLPVQHFVDWMGEWMRDARRAQRGLLLTTAHSAKGLEFDHVAVLDGEWLSRSADARDADTARRLYYVAMTRARHTLLLARPSGEHDWLAPWHELACVLREAPKLPRIGVDEMAVLRREFRQCTPADVFLGYAGRRAASHPAHGAIKRLEVGDTLTLQRSVGGRWELLDGAGCVVGAMSRQFSLSSQVVCEAAFVRGVLVRRRDQEGEPYREQCVCDQWEAVLPELVLKPV